MPAYYVAETLSKYVLFLIGNVFQIEDPFVIVLVFGCVIPFPLDFLKYSGKNPGLCGNTFSIFVFPNRLQ